MKYFKEKILVGILLFIFIIAPLSIHNSAAQQLERLCYTTTGSNCVPGVQAAASAAISVAASTTTQIVALATGKWIFVTSFDFMSAGTLNATLVYGTGSSCGTGTTSLTGAYPLIAQAGIAKGNGTGIVLVIPAGNALCITTSGASQVSGSVSYAQF